MLRHWTTIGLKLAIYNYVRAKLREGSVRARGREEKQERKREEDEEREVRECEILRYIELPVCWEPIQKVITEFRRGRIYTGRTKGTHVIHVCVRVRRNVVLSQ